MSDDNIYGGRSPLAVGARLRLHREVLGLKQSHYANRVGLAPNTYNQLEAGRNFPSVETLWKIADTFDLDMNWLLGGDPANLQFQLADGLHKAFHLRERAGGKQLKK